MLSFAWLIVLLSPWGHGASLMPHLTRTNPASSSQTIACHSAQWTSWQLGNTLALVSHLHSDPARHVSRGQSNTTPTKWARQAGRGGVGWLVFVRRERLMLQLLQHNDERWGGRARPSVCFHQPLSTPAVFLVVSSAHVLPSQRFLSETDHLICHVCVFLPCNGRHCLSRAFLFLL